MGQPKTDKSQANTKHLPPPRLSVWKKLLFALTITVMFFLLGEGLLALCGVRPIMYDEDPFVGFASHIPLFVEQTVDDGTAVMVTAKNKTSFFNQQQFTRKKSPGVFRIFCVGGSTTYGRPYDDLTSFSGWLRELLPVADPSRQWEVINAGGISYASYRVCGVMEELIQYQPDLFIIYSGHNEFLERRTYSSLIEAPQAWTATQHLMSRTRTYAALRKILKRPQPDKDQTILESEVDTILDHSFGPEDYTRDDTLRDQVIDHYRFNLNRMIDIAQSADAGAVLVVPASNLKNCSPFKSESRSDLGLVASQQFKSLLSAAREARAKGDLNEAMAAVEQAQSIDDRFADLHFLRGSIHFNLGEYEPAKASFWRALDEDVCPLRQLRSMSKVVAEVATERKVPLLDFATIVETGAPHGVPGAEIFLDHVHLTVKGYKLLALELIKTLSQQSMVQISSEWNEAAIELVTQKIESQINTEMHGTALKNLGKVLTWAGKNDEAERLIAKAQELLGDDPELLFLRGTAADDRNKLDEAIKFYRETIRLKPTHKRARNNLGADLYLSGNFDEAATHLLKALEIDPNHVDAHNNYGNTLRKLNRRDEAVEQYQEALRLQPDYARAHRNLADTLSELKRFDEAIKHYEEAKRLRPDFIEAYRNLGRLLINLGRPVEAVHQYEEVLRIKPDYAEVRGKLSVLLSTYPDENVRNGRRALELAEELHKSGLQTAQALGTLAAAHAELGNFEQAVQWSEKALESAPEPMKKSLSQYLELYRTGQPLRMNQQQ